MKHHACLALALLLTASAWSQETSAPEELSGAQDAQMITPAPVSIAPETVQLGAEQLKNVLRGDIAVSGSYIDNLFAGSDYGTQAETTISVLPRLSYNWSTPTQNRTFSYSPGFSFYQPSSSLNQIDQVATAAYSFHPAEHVAITFNDQFSDTTNNSGQAYTSNIAASYTPALAPAFAQFMQNQARGEVTVQTGVNTLLGGSGIVSMLHYPDPSQTVGLYNSGSRGASAFFSQRVARPQYFGAQWSYMEYLAYPKPSTQTVQTHTLLAYYSLSSERGALLSVAAGPESYRITDSAASSVTVSWSPYVSASMGWHAPRASAILTYSHMITGGGGMLGVFANDNAALATRWQMLRTWTAGISGAYAMGHNPEPSVRNSIRGGHSIFGSAVLDHAINPHLSVLLEYDRSHQAYEGIPSIAANPDSNRGMASLVWHFTRSLGY